ELVNVGQDRWVTRRVKTVAPVIDAVAGQLKASRQPAWALVTLEDGGSGSPQPCQAKSGPDPRGPGAQDDDATRLGQAMYLSCQSMKFSSPHSARPWSRRRETCSSRRALTASGENRPVSAIRPGPQ